jgi:hypothetical protein
VSRTRKGSKGPGWEPWSNRDEREAERVRDLERDAEGDSDDETSGRGGTTNAPTREEREAIRARVEKATPGPWLWGWSDHLVWLAVVGGAASVICRIHNEVSGLPLTKEDQDNAAFIAAARYDVPRLLEALEEAEREGAKYKLEAENYFIALCLIKNHGSDDPAKLKEIARGWLGSEP